MTFIPNRQQDKSNPESNTTSLNPATATNQNVLMENPAYPTVSYDQGGESNYDTVRGTLDN